MENSLFHSLIDIRETKAGQMGKSDLVLEKARWAASIFNRYNRQTTMAIAEAVSNAAFEMAAEFAEKAVEETGFGVKEHKKIKNEMASRYLFDYYSDQDYVNPRFNEKKKIVEIPRPAGVIFALIPSTNPIATLNYKIILALLTRNAIVISPHPAAKLSSVEAVQRLIDIAEKSGAPEGVIQVLSTPSIPMVEAFMRSPKTNVILATGGTPMVRAAYSSSNPAIGVGPGNVPVYVDSSANLKLAAQRIITSKSFDNSVLCTNESVLITVPEVENNLKVALKANRAHLCSKEETDSLRKFLFHSRGFNVEAIGRNATWIARECGIRVSSEIKVLITPIDKIGVEEPLSKEKLCPVLAFHVAKGAKQAITQSRAVLRISGAGHSAAIHSEDEKIIIDYSTQVEVYRVVVNAPCSQGAAGIDTNLAPTFTIGTGYYGKSSIGDNIGPQHLIHWTKIAYNKDKAVAFGHFNNIEPSLPGAIPEAPAGNSETFNSDKLSKRVIEDSAKSDLRNEIRKLISEELKHVLGKRDG
jgi:acyl-CoA reductase-like NAD-dependent aldehyde dehydrogenase